MNALLAQLDRAPSCPLRKALIMLFRGEMSKRISRAFAVTERKANRTLREKYLDVRDQRARSDNDEMRSISVVLLKILAVFC